LKVKNTQGTAEHNDPLPESNLLAATKGRNGGRAGEKEGADKDFRGKFSLGAQKELRKLDMGGFSADTAADMSAWNRCLAESWTKLRDGSTWRVFLGHDVQMPMPKKNTGGKMGRFYKTLGGCGWSLLTRISLLGGAAVVMCCEVSEQSGD